MKKEVELITCACPRTHNTAVPSDTEVDWIDMPLFMEQSIRFYYKEGKTTNDNVPCAVCYVSTRPTVVMIPAKASCPPTWTREYYGYLMTEYKGHHRTMFECVDEDQESLPGSYGNTDGATFHHVEAACNSLLPCPPYNNNKELNCVVCTK